jgi:hypothetical protein
MCGFANLKFVNDNIYRGLASRLNTNNVSLFDAQAISNIMWALASTGIPLQDKLLSNFDTYWQSSSDIRIHHPDSIDPVLQCCAIAAREFMNRPHEFNPQNLANLCWSFATLGVKDVQFLKMAEEEVKCRINKFQKGGSEAMTAFNGQGIANILW